MALVHRLRQRVGNAGADPDHRRLLDAQLHGDRVGGLEANAADVVRQPVGVFRHDLHGVGAVCLVNAHRAGRADAVAVQEDHDLPHDLLLGPGVGDPFGSDRTDARDLAQALGLRLDRVEHLLAKGANQLLGVDRPNAADHPGAKVFLDAVDRCRRRGAHEPRLELLAVCPVVHPFARRSDPFARGNHRRVADGGNQIAAGDSDLWIDTIVDATQNWKFSTQVSYASTLVSAEWIQEARSSAPSVLPLADYVTAT